MIRALFVLLVLIAVLILAGIAIEPARAQTVCLKADDMIAGLMKGYREQSLIGLLDKGQNWIARLYVATDTTDQAASWSIVVFRTDGIACIVMTGIGIDRTAKSKPGKPL